MREHSTVGIILIVFMKTAKRNLQAVPMVKEFITVLSFLTNHKNIIIHQRGEILLHLYQENIMVIPILADDWADEFGDGDYDGGYDDAYDYWEENGN